MDLFAGPRMVRCSPTRHVALTYPPQDLMIALGQHTRAGIEENLWDKTKGRRMTRFR